jgi:hypothetical protein
LHRRRCRDIYILMTQKVSETFESNGTDINWHYYNTSGFTLLSMKTFGCVRWVIPPLQMSESLRYQLKILDFAERACRASKPTWGIASLRQTTDLPQDTSLRERVEHPGLPGVLRHSVKLRTLPQDTSLRERVEKNCLCWTSLAWWRRLHSGVDNDNVLFLEARLKVTTRCSRQTIFAGLPASRVNNGSDWLPPSDAAFRIGMRAMWPSHSESRGISPVPGFQFWPKSESLGLNGAQLQWEYRSPNQSETHNAQWTNTEGGEPAERHRPMIWYDYDIYFIRQTMIARRSLTSHNIYPLKIIFCKHHLIRETEAVHYPGQQNYKDILWLRHICKNVRQVTNNST